MTVHLLGCLAGISGLAGALTLLAQTRTMLRARRACEISLLLLSSWTAGYVVWVAYGMALSNAVLITVNGVGAAGAAAALVVAVRLRRTAPCDVSRQCFTQC